MPRKCMRCSMPPTDPNLDACLAKLGVDADVTAEALKRAHLQRSYALIRVGASEEQRERLRQAHAVVLAYVEARDRSAVGEGDRAAGDSVQRIEDAGKTIGVERSEVGSGRLEAHPTAARRRPFDTGQNSGHTPWGGRVVLESCDAALAAGLRAEAEADRDRPDARWERAVLAPVVALLAVLIQRSGLGFLLAGFHVWIHEFGHATIAWMTGHRALPLPIGWTNIEPDKSLFVYVGVLFLFGVLGVAGWRERKPSAVFSAVALIGLQAYMTWLLPNNRGQMWITFGGVGGEFYLAAAMMGLFYFELPEKFKWRVCRYVFLFIAAASFARSYTLWSAVWRGTEPIPYGTMVNGEDDASGDMDTLRDDYRWSEHQIAATYHHLGNVCLVVLALVYVVMAFRLYTVPLRLLRRGQIATD